MTAGTSLALLAAHVGATLARDASHSADVALASGGALALVATACAFRPSLQALRTSRFSAYAWLLAWSGLAIAVDDVGAFARAYAFAALLLAPLVVLDALGRVRYRVHRVDFVVSRAAAYAGVRVVGRLAAREGLCATRVARLLPLGLASLETLGMAVFGHEGSYDFEDAAQFGAYAALKSAAFAALPMAEDALAP